MVALDINPRNGRLYGVQNGRDQLSELWPEIFTPAQDLVLPSEELFRIDLNADYGWPYCFHDPDRGKVLAPEYGGDGTIEGRCAAVREPLSRFPAHWAPLSMLFYTGHQFPGALSARRVRRVPRLALRARRPAGGPGLQRRVRAVRERPARRRPTRSSPTASRGRACRCPTPRCTGRWAWPRARTARSTSPTTRAAASGAWCTEVSSCRTRWRVGARHRGALSPRRAMPSERSTSSAGSGRPR